VNIREAIISAINSADDAVRAYGAGPSEMPELYANSILARVGELSGAGDVESMLSDNARYRRALEYIANAPVSTETEIVLQGRAMIGLLHKGTDDGEDE
jgi:hypothetical protein